MSEFKRTTVIQNVTQKDGETNGKPWTLYDLECADGKPAATFSESLAEKALEAKGQTVTLLFEVTSKKNKFGKEQNQYTLKDITTETQTEAKSESGLSPKFEKLLPIERACGNAALRFQGMKYDEGVERAYITLQANMMLDFHIVEEDKKEEKIETEEEVPF